jgi:hypothetical protein
VRNALSGSRLPLFHRLDSLPEREQGVCLWSFRLERVGKLKSGSRKMIVFWFSLILKG